MARGIAEKRETEEELEMQINKSLARHRTMDERSSDNIKPYKPL